MFDIGFSELVVIAVVSLIVIGPERLPRVARTLGHLMGRLQRYVSDVKSDINREMELDELRRLQTQVKDTARSVEQSFNQVTSGFESTVRSVEQDLSGTSTSATAAAPPTAASGGAASESPPVPASNSTPNAAPTAPLPSGQATAAPRQASLPGFDQG